MSSGKHWPIGIVVALLLFVAGNAVVIRLAVAPDAVAHDPQYYQRAMNFDAEQAVRARQARLGWRVEAQAEASAPASRLRISVTDAQGAPVSGATVRVSAFHLAHANTIVEARAEARGDAYEASVPISTAGRWQVAIDVRRGVEHVQVDRRLEVPRATVATR